jgi:hypothetical protein
MYKGVLNGALILQRVRFGGPEGIGLIPRCNASKTRVQGSTLEFNANYYGIRLERFWF